MAQVNEIVNEFAKLRVAVIGDAMLDTYLTGTCDRLSQEAPVPVVAVSGRVDAPGGAANVAVNLSAMGAQVTLLGAVGLDCESDILCEFLKGLGVDTSNLLHVVGRKSVPKGVDRCE